MLDLCTITSLLVVNLIKQEKQQNETNCQQQEMKKKKWNELPEEI